MEEIISNITWNEHNNVGVEVIDEAHKRLFGAVVKLNDIIHADKHESNIYACQEMIKFLKSYVLKHFAEEEEYMRSINYEDYPRHKGLHDNLANNVLPEIEKQLEDSNYAFESIQIFLGICLGWLTGHIMTEDKLINKKKIEGEIRDVTRTEGVDMLSDVISQVVKDMFDIDCLLISNNVNLEHIKNLKLKKTINYELTYATGTSQKIIITICLEERLVLKTIGKMPGIDFYEINDMVISATQELAKILMQRIKAMFKRQGGHFKFESDRMVDSKELKKKYKDTKPMFSLLYNTPLGAFIFCIDKE